MSIASSPELENEGQTIMTHTGAKNWTTSNALAISAMLRA
jgi:hypothetical protein